MHRLAIALVLLASVACAQSTAPIPTPFNPLPRTSSFFTDVVTWMRNEIYQEQNEWQQPWVVAGCFAGTAAGLTHIPAACTAYTRGYRVTETNSITYPDASTCYVVVDPATSGNVTGLNSAVFQRIGVSHYVMNCDGAGSQGIAQEPMVMIVTTTGGAIAAVVDVRNFTPIVPTDIVQNDPTSQALTWTWPNTVVPADGDLAVHTTTETVGGNGRDTLVFLSVQLEVRTSVTVQFNQCIVNLKVNGVSLNQATLTAQGTPFYNQNVTLVGSFHALPGAHVVQATVTAVGAPGCDQILGRTVIVQL